MSQPNIIPMANYHLNRKPAVAPPIIRDEPVRTPAMRRSAESARLVRDLRRLSDGFVSMAEARRLMARAADEIDRLQQLPLFP